MEKTEFRFPKWGEVIDGAPKNLTIQDAFAKCWQVLQRHDKILVSLSGGSDSDIMADLIIRCGGKEKAVFVFFNTGLEYEATKKQIKRLEEKYGIEIKINPPIKPIPLCVREYGVPFWSKKVSEYIERLQRHGFQWEDEPVEVLLERYPKCRAGVRWWCNDFSEGDEPCRYDIGYIKGLKEFMMANPPDFAISPKCCHYAKKLPASKFAAASGCDLSCSGVRKSEGGVRSTVYQSCYSQALGNDSTYRPLFWFVDQDKREYDEHYGIVHSDCYEVWGMKRTGCAGCPFGKKFEEELALAEKYEPKFHKAMLKVFGKSYDYTRRFMEFREQMKNSSNDVAGEGVMD